MKRILALLLAALMSISLLTACGGDKSAADQDDGGNAESVGSGQELKFITGNSSGTYFAFGTVLGGQVSGSTDSRITAIEGKGSQGNVEMLVMNGAQLGFVQSDVMSYAYEGSHVFADIGKVENISTVAALYQEQVQIVTCDPAIKTVADLAGKNVSVGESGSGVYYNAVDVLGVYGMDLEKDIKPQYLGFGESAEALKDGKIDAAFVVAGAPTVAITDLSATKDTYLVSLDQEHVDTLVEQSPYYSATVIPADVYKQEADVTTVAVSAVVVARDDVSEGDIYNFVSGVFSNIEAIKAAHAKGAELDLEFAASVTSVPYHPGAAKYFAEQGIEVPVK